MDPMQVADSANGQSSLQLTHHTCNTTINHFQPGKEPVARQNALSIVEVKTLLAEVKSNFGSCDLQDVITIVAATGIRSGELGNLRWADVDLVQRQIMVDSKRTGHKRQIPFGPILEALLKARKDRSPNAEFVLGARPAPLMRGISLKLAKLSNAQFKDRRLSLHLLRHSFITWLAAAAGGDVSTLITLAGFSPRRMKIRTFCTGVHANNAAADIQSAIEQELLGD
jgi:integrase